jgi:hypothetical protein
MRADIYKCYRMNWSSTWHQSINMHNCNSIYFLLSNGNGEPKGLKAEEEENKQCADNVLSPSAFMSLKCTNRWPWLLWAAFNKRVEWKRASIGNFIVHLLNGHLFIKTQFIWRHSHYLVWPGLRSPYTDWLRAARPRGRSSSHSRGERFLFYTSSRPVLGPTRPPI